MLSNAYALDYGDGSDGACNLSGANTINKATWNCTSLTLNNATVAAGVTSVVTFKVQGTVTITGNNTANGGAGATAGTAGTKGAAGGFDGGAGINSAVMRFF